MAPMIGEDQHLESPRFKICYREYIVDDASENTWNNRLYFQAVRFRTLLYLELAL